MEYTFQAARNSIEAVIDSIHLENRQPDQWEFENIIYAIHLLRSRMFMAAINRAELAAIDSSLRSPVLFEVKTKKMDCEDLRTYLFSFVDNT